MGDRFAPAHLTDGVHFDNLGLYELLKRRCSIIVAVDAEADATMNFESLIRLQRYAQIDLGVRIDLPSEELRRFSRKITVENPHDPNDDVDDCIGPHVALGRIEYGREADQGPDGAGAHVRRGGGPRNRHRRRKVDVTVAGVEDPRFDQAGGLAAGIQRTEEEGIGAARLEYSARARVPQAQVVEAAIASHLAPDAADQLEAAVACRLDRMSRAIERMERTR